MTILAHAGHGSSEIAANSFLHFVTSVAHLPMALSFTFSVMLLAVAVKVYKSTKSN